MAKRTSDARATELQETAMFDIGSAMHRLPITRLRIEQALQNGAPSRLLEPAIESLDEIERLLDTAQRALGKLRRMK